MKKKSLLPAALGVGLLCGILLSACCLPEFANLSRYQGMQAAANGLAIGCAAGLGCWAINRSRSPQKRREMERADRDERSRMIWDRAAYTAWMITLAAYVVAELALTALECMPGMIAVGLLFWIHVAAYLAAVYVLNRKY